MVLLWANLEWKQSLPAVVETKRVISHNQNKGFIARYTSATGEGE